METFATGLKRIKDLCDEAGCKVEFRIDKDDFVVVFYRNLREAWVPNNSETALNSVPNKASNEALNEALNENEKKIVEIIRANPYVKQKEITEETIAEIDDET